MGAQKQTKIDIFLEQTNKTTDDGDWETEEQKQKKTL